jgi:hypothetical protein
MSFYEEAIDEQGSSVFTGGEGVVTENAPENQVFKREKDITTNPHDDLKYPLTTRTQNSYGGIQ